MCRCLISLLIVLGFDSSWAATASDFPIEISVSGKTLKLKGSGYRTATWFKVKVYHAALYLEDLSASPENVTSLRVLDIIFDRDVSKDDVTKAWQESLKKNCPSPCKVEPDLIARFIAAASAVKNKDRLRYQFSPGQVQAIGPGTATATYENEFFPTILLGTWIGAHPPTEDLKRGLLGRK